MTLLPSELRREFTRGGQLFARVTPRGFVVDGEVHKELVGRLGKTQLVRKLFVDGTLACDSQDGVSARGGRVCETCDETGCQPQLRMRLHAPGDMVVIVDLASSSARNLFAVEDHLVKSGRTIADADLRLFITDRGRWGEVRFEVL